MHPVRHVRQALDAFEVRHVFGVGLRIALPLRRSMRHRLRVRQVRWESPDVFSVYLVGRDLDQLPMRAGQFANWRFLTGTGWMRAHPYSLSALPRRDQLRITVRAGGDDAARITTARPGTRVLMEGPYGRLTAAVRTRPRLLFLAAGIGITPLRALLEELPYRPGDADLVYRANTEDGFALRAELDRIAARRGARIHYLSGPPRARSSWLPAVVGSSVRCGHSAAGRAGRGASRRVPVWSGAVDGRGTGGAVGGRGAQQPHPRRGLRVVRRQRGSQ
jgi:predicted ferric reductase